MEEILGYYRQTWEHAAQMLQTLVYAGEVLDLDQDERNVMEVAAGLIRSRVLKVK